ncbi:DNA-directed RNA polymerase subunit delta [Laceyella putida]|uniref:Probable DNA-directed RNA polymerase subunit delta n=1 Tax=Laceyella putida TaxID=110101 RepID=A0ABW2RGM9_9BACL
MKDNLVLEKIKETSMVDLAYELLKQKGDAMQYRDIMADVAKKKEFTQEEVENYIAQLYTEINIDGRFVCVGRGTWGLREWYSTEQATDSAVAMNVKDDYLDDDLEDELFEADDEDFANGNLDELDEIDVPYAEDDEAPFEAEETLDEADADEDEEEEL